jgi:hypothetical protein
MSDLGFTDNNKIVWHIHEFCSRKIE